MSNRMKLIVPFIGLVIVGIVICSAFFFSPTMKASAQDINTPIVAGTVYQYRSTPYNGYRNSVQCLCDVVAYTSFTETEYVNLIHVASIILDTSSTPFITYFVQVSQNYANNLTLTDGDLRISYQSSDYKISRYSSSTSTWTNVKSSSSNTTIYIYLASEENDFGNITVDNYLKDVRYGCTATQYTYSFLDLPVIDYYQQCCISLPGTPENGTDNAGEVLMLQGFVLKNNPSRGLYVHYEYEDSIFDYDLGTIATSSSYRLFCPAVPSGATNVYLYLDGSTDYLVADSVMRELMSLNYDRLTGADFGYSAGYIDGYTAGYSTDNNLVDLMWVAFQMPFKLMFGTYDSSTGTYQGGIFTFTILGVDIRAFILGILSLVLVISIIKIILGRR